jgi:hypothetical protein
MRTVALVLLAGAIVAPTAVASPVPEDVGASLAAECYPVADASLPPSSLPVGPRRALRVAMRNLGWAVLPYGARWSRVGRITVHLVQLREPPTADGRCSFMNLNPIRVGDLAWLVVIRDATIPLIGPPGRPGPKRYVAPLAVFVRTDVPVFVRAMTL